MTVPGIELYHYPMTDLNALLNGFHQNPFDPNRDSDKDLPNAQGNYLFCLRNGSPFHFAMINTKPKLSLFEELEVIYTGVASRSLRGRDYKIHFGDNAGRSTLRKSLGVLFGYRQIQRDQNPLSGKNKFTKFNEADETTLRNWMISNLLMFYFINSDWKADEIQLINYFKPPLNLRDNHDPENVAFRQLLKRLRVEKSTSKQDF